MSKNALPITVIMGGRAIFSFLPDRTRNGNWTCAQPKTIWRSSHHCGCRYLNHDDARLAASRIGKGDLKVAVLFCP